MLCGRGLRTTHIHRPLTTYFFAAKISIIFVNSKFSSSECKEKFIFSAESRENSPKVKLLHRFLCRFKNFLYISRLWRWVTLNHYIATSTKICCTFCTLCTWKIFNKYGSTHLYTAYYVDIRRFSGHESSFKNAHTPSYIKASLLLHIAIRNINIKATVCSKTTCFAKFRGTLRKNRGAIFSNGAAIFSNGASIFSKSATVWLNFLENSETKRHQEIVWQLRIFE